MSRITAHTDPVTGKNAKLVLAVMIVKANSDAVSAAYYAAFDAYCDYIGALTARRSARLMPRLRLLSWLNCSTKMPTTSMTSLSWGTKPKP